MSTDENRRRALERLQATKEKLARERNIGSVIPQQRHGGISKNTSFSTTRIANSSSGGAGATNSSTPSQHRNATDQRPLKPVSKKFKNYIDYDFSKMTDSRGGFLQDEGEVGTSASSLTLEEWQKQQKLQQAPTLPNNPDAPKCFDCGTVELDFMFYNVFKVRVCQACRKKYPEKYSLLTKTECKEDYLLTDPELRDEELLPHLERPNPHKKTYTNMMLYVRYQVEEFAFKKWGGAEGLDQEYERREEAKKVRKEKKFLDKITEMRKRTRAEALTRSRAQPSHEHEWVASSMDSATKTISRRCVVCGMTTEEIVF